MVQKYNCEICKYPTDRLSSYNKHLRTNKHMKNKKKIEQLRRLINGEHRNIKKEDVLNRNIKKEDVLNRNDNILSNSTPILNINESKDTTSSLKTIKGFTCEHCNTYYKDKSHKARHIKSCKDKSELKRVKKELIDTKKELVDTKKELIKYKNKLIKG